MRWRWCLLSTRQNQHAQYDFHSASSLRQQSVGRHVAPLEHIFLIPSQPVCSYSFILCVFIEKQHIPIFIVFGLIRPAIEPTIYHIRGEHANHYITDEVSIISNLKLYLSIFQFYQYSFAISTFIKYCYMWKTLKRLLIVRRYDVVRISILLKCGTQSKSFHMGNLWFRNRSFSAACYYPSKMSGCWHGLSGTITYIPRN